MLRQNWWKIVCVVLLFYTLIAGFLGEVPAKPILNETIRNLYFHVAMWMAMMITFIVSLIYSIKYLRTNNPLFDIYALEYAKTGIVFGALVDGGIVGVGLAAECFGGRELAVLVEQSIEALFVAGGHDGTS